MTATLQVSFLQVLP